MRFIDEPAYVLRDPEQIINPWPLETRDKIQAEFKERRKNQTRNIHKLIDSGYKMCVSGNILIFTAKNF